VVLAEDDILLGPFDGAPGSHAPFQRAPDIGIKAGMPPPDLVKDGDRPDARRRFQDRHDFGVPNLSERIGPPASARRLFLGGQTRIVLDPVAGRGAEAGLGGGNSGVVGLSETHIQPHLMVGDVEAGQALIPRY
jgi:hypothetical protein